jgi:hypothetical protein
VKRMRCKKCGYEFVQVHTTPREDHTKEQCLMIQESVDKYFEMVLNSMPVERMLGC